MTILLQMKAGEVELVGAGDIGWWGRLGGGSGGTFRAREAWGRKK
jgi:hypothetical protein